MIFSGGFKEDRSFFAGVFANLVGFIVHGRGLAGERNDLCVILWEERKWHDCGIDDCCCGALVVGSAVDSDLPFCYSIQQFLDLQTLILSCRPRPPQRPVRQKISAAVHSCGACLLMEPQRTAILSVFDKTGLLDLVKGLIHHKIRLLASGGTAKLIREAGFHVEWAPHD